jgi:hypothetical protein
MISLADESSKASTQAMAQENNDKFYLRIEVL